ncbi:MAG: hypothetical protein U0744_20610 [Gemmataceae bacterium]
MSLASVSNALGQRRRDSGAARPPDADPTSTMPSLSVWSSPVELELPASLPFRAIRKRGRGWRVDFCRMVGKREIPVASGAEPQPKQDIGGQYQYRYHPAVIFNRTSRPVKESAVEFLYRKLKEDQGNVTIIAVGPAYVARLIDEHPDNEADPP